MLHEIMLTAFTVLANQTLTSIILKALYKLIQLKVNKRNWCFLRMQELIRMISDSRMAEERKEEEEVVTPVSRVVPHPDKSRHVLTTESETTRGR